ncbi:hypothetical protein J6590_004101 [Homalodisca vitripennis]|nr:hypothetical protein J6590_004101 [Homalodisca vitripennis]
MVEGSLLANLYLPVEPPMGTGKAKPNTCHLNLGNSMGIQERHTMPVLTGEAVPVIPPRGSQQETAPTPNLTNSEYAPEASRNMLQTRSEIRERCPRQGNMLEVPKVRLEVGRNAFSYISPPICNEIP